jgi:hypothetical protein
VIPPGPSASTLTLYIGVSWFWGVPVGTLGIDVDVDGRSVTRGQTFPTPAARKKPDSFHVDLTKGRHRLRARCGSENAAFEVEFEITARDRYAQLSYNYYPKDHPYYQQHRPFDPQYPHGREGFAFKIQDRDFGWR